MYPELHVPEDRPGFLGKLENRGLRGYCLDYNPPSENNVEGHQALLYLCHGMGQNQFFECTSQQEMQYNIRQPESCIAVEEGKDVLVMDLCNDTVPENQEFILQEDGTLVTSRGGNVWRPQRSSTLPLLRTWGTVATQTNRGGWFFKERKS